MDETEKYLNQILKKRLGSVVNYGGSSKTAVTRIPKQQEKVQSMPTVFRKKHQTVYIQGNMNSHYSQAQSEYLSIKQGSKTTGFQLNDQQQVPQQVRQTSNQRVEYMLISKRIQNKKEDVFISPTVDITKYSKQNSVINTINKPPIQEKKIQKEDRFMQNGRNLLNKMNLHSNEFHNQRTNNRQMNSYNEFEENNEQNRSLNQNYALQSHLSNNTDKSKRKKIFRAQ